MLVEIIGYTSGFVAKQYFCFKAIGSVKTQLQRLITQIAIQHIGKFAAALVGAQLGVAFALPATLLLGDCIALAVNIITHTILRIAISFFKKQQPSFRFNFKSLIFRIVSFTTGYFAKAYFCCYAMPSVRSGVQWTFTKILQCTVHPTLARLFAWNIALLSTVQATIILGDLLGSMISLLSMKTLCFINTKLKGTSVDCLQQMPLKA